MCKGVPIVSAVLPEKVHNLEFVLVPYSKPGNGWLQHFKNRHSISYKNIVREAVTADDVLVQAPLNEHLNSSFASYAPRGVSMQTKQDPAGTRNRTRVCLEPECCRLLP